jgi:predicted RNA-binding protein YlqC (UPF0109 family)
MKREPQSPIAKAIHSLIKGTCIKPETLDVIETLRDNKLELVFLPDMCDFRILIGSKGKTITALQHVAQEMGRGSGLEVGLELRESYIGERLPMSDFELNPGFKGPEMLPILDPFLELLFDPLPTVRFEDKGEKLYIIIDVPEEELPLIKAMGVAFYPYGFRHGRRLSFRIVDYHETENETPTNTDGVSPGVA